MHLIRSISQKEFPLLYWLVVLTWIGLSIDLIVIDLLSFLGGSA